MEDIPKILSAHADAGGNFFDIADQYQLGEAEEIVGRFIGSNRHNYIICTKYTRRLISEGAAGIVYACTEIPILLRDTNISVTTFDTTLIHAKAAAAFALG